MNNNKYINISIFIGIIFVMTNKLQYNALHIIKKRFYYIYKSLQSTNTQINNNNNKVIIITGATAVGKSAIANILAKQSNSEIVIADSVQIYKHLTIGSNKPSKQEIIDIKHHMIDICDCNTNYSSGDFVRQSSSIINNILSNGKTPIVVGGVTMWIDWLVKGIPNNPKASSEITDEVKLLIEPYESKKAWDDAIESFKHYDHKIINLSRNDWYRLSRYIEISIHRTRYQDNKQPNHREKYLDNIDFRCYFISEDRESLYRVIDSRCYDMIKSGLFDEVYQLIINNHINTKSMGAKAIGYRQTLEYLCRDNFKENDIKAFTKFLLGFAAATRNYAKRQMHWYRNDKDFLWLKIDRSLPNIYDLAVDEIKHWNEVAIDHFNDMIDIQLSRSKAINEVRCMKKNELNQLFRDDDVLSLERQALNQLVQSNEINGLVDTNDLSSDEDSSKWTANNFLIRASESKVSSKKLLEYLSLYHNNKKYDEEFLVYIKQADAMISSLRNDYTNQYNEFQRWLVDEQKQDTSNELSEVS